MADDTRTINLITDLKAMLRTHAGHEIRRYAEARIYGGYSYEIRTERGAIHQNAQDGVAQAMQRAMIFAMGTEDRVLFTNYPDAILCLLAFGGQCFDIRRADEG